MVQRRTLEDLIDVGEGRPFDRALAVRFRERIASAAEEVRGAGGRLRLSKDRLKEQERCEGLFHAVLSGEREPFRHSLQSAAGTLLHKCVELEVGSRDESDANELGRAAAERLSEDRGFAPFWRELPTLEQDELVAETARRLELFRATFPPLRELRRRLAPITELFVEVTFAGGAVSVSGRIDLALGRPDPARATRVLIDLKTGGAWPEHPEDMRLYALLHTLRFGVPPHRVATLFLGSGDWQSEDVGEGTLGRAADRVVAAIESAARGEQTRELTPGPYCSWCPRRQTCPEALVRGPPDR